jgi:uncharacterized protein (TIGR02246 family)
VNVTAFISVIAVAIVTPLHSMGAEDRPAAPKIESRPSSDTVAIANLRESWLRSLRSKKLEAATALYASDAVFLPPTGERIAGYSAIHDLYQKVMATFDSDLTLDSRSVRVSGDLAFDCGEFHETLVTIATGARNHIHGQYFMLLTRLRDGTWKIAYHIWTESPETSQKEANQPSEPTSTSVTPPAGQEERRP